MVHSAAAYTHLSHFRSGNPHDLAVGRNLPNVKEAAYAIADSVVACLGDFFSRSCIQQQIIQRVRLSHSILLPPFCGSLHAPLLPVAGDTELRGLSHYTRAVYFGPLF